MKKSKLLTIFLVLALTISTLVIFTACKDDTVVENTGAYVLTDKATFLSMKKNADGDLLPNLEILLEKTAQLQNTYTLIAVDPDGAGFGETKPTLNTDGADALINWFNLASTRALIADYGKDTYGEALFTILETAPTAFTGAIPQATEQTDTIELSTTTSVKDSGLLTPLLAKFKADYGYTVNVFAKGTGISIANATSGNADLILVHAKSQEDAFVTDGYARKVSGYTSERISFMYNFFVICGNKADPANIKNATDAGAALKAIADGKYNFVSRGDASGTHSAEINLWKAAGFTNISFTKDSAGVVTINAPAEYTWYNALGKGMGATLTAANAMATKADTGAENTGAYVLTDKATFLSMKKNADGDLLPNLEILLEKTAQLQNTYTLIAVDPDGAGFGETKPTLNTDGADALINWFNLASTRALIADYGKDTYGEALFTILETAPTAFTGAIPQATEQTDTIELSTTTSVKDSGLLTPLLAKFKADYGYTVNVFAKGTGISIANATSGNADLILVHAKSQEDAFVTDGYARKVSGYTSERISFMYNFFVICGNKADPANIKNATDAGAALKAIADGKYNFVSRGDASGTHSAEINLWKAAGFTNISFTKDSAGVVTINAPAEYTWYNALGKGMGATLTAANAMATKAA